jgi:FkbM family methyltransferase
MNKSIINKFLRAFGAELHGLGYLNSLAKNSFKKDPFTAQSELRLQQETKVIFDVGANVGKTATKYLNLFPKAKLHAFEPIPEANLKFKETHANHTNIVLNCCGLSNKIGEAKLNVNESIDTSSVLESQEIGASSDKLCKTVKQIEIQVQTIDNYCKEADIDRIDILKIDTQGSELNILKGAEKMLQNKAIDVIFSEVYFKEQYVDQPTMYEIALFLKQYGYELYDLYEIYYNEKQMLWGDAIFIKV